MFRTVRHNHALQNPTGVPPMHKSTLSGFIIDCKTGDLDAAARFWGGALGMEVRALPGQEDHYVQLMDEHTQLHIEVQAVSHESRVHLDIETDDVEAEVRRIEALGAKRLKKVRTWWVMQAPTGQRFCVVQTKGGGFAQKARTWK